MFNDGRKRTSAFLLMYLGCPIIPIRISLPRDFCLCPQAVLMVVPLLQVVIQADGAHSQFGKYTLFLAYGMNANGHMSAIGFGLLFGNEDKTNWNTFWTFIKTLHPSLNAPIKTILMDQDKGSIPAFKEIFEDAAQYMCSFHHRQNILKM